MGWIRLGTFEFEDVDGDGDAFYVTDIDGWTGTPVDIGAVEKPVSDGAVVAYARRRGKPLTVSGVAATPDAAGWARIRNKLEALCDGLVTATATLEVDEPDGTTRALTVRLADALRVRRLGPAAVEFEIPLLAADPAKTIVGS